MVTVNILSFGQSAYKVVEGNNTILQLNISRALHTDVILGLVYADVSATRSELYNILLVHICSYSIATHCKHRV